jgi:tetratricopeptide (TPR) repeat protein
MSAANRPAATGSGRSRGLERLTALWALSTVVLLVLTVLAFVYASGASQRSADQLATLEQEVSTLEGETGRLRSALANQGETLRGVEQRLEAAEAGLVDLRGRLARTESAPPAGPEGAVSPGRTAEAQIGERLRVLVTRPMVTPRSVRDWAAAERLLDDAAADLDATWSPALWIQLAQLARLTGRDGLAEQMARRAGPDVDGYSDYVLLSARALLARGNPADAEPFAAMAAERGAVAGRVLWADALWRQGAADAARAELADLEDANLAALPAYDLLRLARMLIVLEVWPPLQATADTLERVPAALTPAHGLVSAVLQLRAGNVVAGLALLDHLAARLEQYAADDTLHGWDTLAPDAYEVHTWRGAALLAAGQHEAAEQVLQGAIELQPDRPDAWLRLGEAALRMNETQDAIAHLERAVELGPGLAAAWEMLGMAEYRLGDTAAALSNLREAVRLDGQRSYSVLMIAVVHAERDEQEQAAAALRQALRLNPELLVQAQEAYALKRIFTPEEIQAMAEGEPATTQPAEADG